MTTLRHEIIHALKDRGLIRDAEWKAMKEWARKNGYLDRARKEYASQNLSEEALYEEAVAQAFAEWTHGTGRGPARGQAKGQPLPGLVPAVRRAFARIRDLLTRLANALRGMGFTSAESIFRSIERGEVGRRPKGYAAMSAAERARYRELSPGDTNSPEFKAWFGDSKVVGADGKPLRVYHGTAGDFEAFDAGKASSSSLHATSYLGHFFTPDAEIAGEFVPTFLDHATWPMQRSSKQGGNIIPAYLSVQRPYEMPLAEFRGYVRENDWKAMKALRARLEAEGYDGIHIAGDASLADTLGAMEWGADTWIAFRPEQIKSAFNRGSWSKSDPRMRYAMGGEKRGPDDFVPAADGSLDLGIIDEEVAAAIGGEAAPIRLQEGWHDDAADKGFGRVHIEAQRGEAIRKAGYPDAAAFVADTAAGYTQVYEAKDGRRFLVKRNGRVRLAVIEMNRVAGVWTVVSGGIYRPSYLHGKKLLWEGERRSRPAAGDADSPLLRGGQNSKETIEPDDDGSQSPDEGGAKYSLFGMKAARSEHLKDPKQTRGTPEQEEALGRIFGKKDSDKGYRERAREQVEAYKDQGIKNYLKALSDPIRQGLFDRFHAVSAIARDAKLPPIAWKALQLTTNLTSVMAHILRHSPLEVYDDPEIGLWFRPRTGWDKSAGFETIFKDLADKGLLDLWKGWKVAQRADRLTREGRENLMGRAEIDALKDLHRKHPEFLEVDRKWNDFNEAMLDTSEAAGLISKEMRKLLSEHGDYVPFYRIVEPPGSPTRGELIAPGKGKWGVASSGMFPLKGGTAQLNDPIQNMVRNMTAMTDRVPGVTPPPSRRGVPRPHPPLLPRQYHRRHVV